MSSQPNTTRSDNLPRVHLGVNGDLVVSAVETFEALWDALDAEPVPNLAALLASSHRAACYIDKPAPRHQLAEGKLSPSAQRLLRLAPGAVAEAATAAGCSTFVWRIWSDEHRAAYTEDPRTVEVLRVESAWDFTSIDPAGRTESEIVKSGRIDVGDYLVASVGVSALCVRKVGRADQAPATGNLAALTAFRANRITATCSRCRRSWVALDGATYFHPTTNGALPWQMEDVGEYGLVTNTIACVDLQCPGRIAFRIGTSPQP